MDKGEALVMKATYYFSGIDRAAFLALLAQEGAAGMVNANVALQDAMLSAFARWPEVKLVLDSGAFQGNRDVSRYADLCLQIGSRFQWVANLDVIGDQIASDANWRQLRDRGVNSLWIYQVGGGASLACLGEMAQELTHVGVGGLVPLVKSSPHEAAQLIAQIGKYLSAANAKAHFFGVSTPVILAEFANETWFASADSQSWLCGFKALEMLAADGRRVKASQIGLALTKAECAAQNIRQIHNWISGKEMQLALL